MIRVFEPHFDEEDLATIKVALLERQYLNESLFTEWFERTRGWLSKLPTVLSVLWGTTKISTAAAWAAGGQLLKQLLPKAKRVYDAVYAKLEVADAALERVAVRVDAYVDKGADALGTQIARAILRSRHLISRVKTSMDTELNPKPQLVPIAAAA